LIIPGIVASFIVPLFLSIGRSTLFTDLVKGNEDFYVNLFILFAFCLLASVSAKSFVNALAQQALKTADEAKKEAVEAKDLSAEAIEAKISVEERGDKANFNIETADSINNYDGTNEERIVLSSLLNGEYVRRSITGIANETKLSKIDVRKALDSLVKRGAVIQAQSQRTGTLLYQAVLGASKAKQ